MTHDEAPAFLNEQHHGVLSTLLKDGRAHPAYRVRLQRRSRGILHDVEPRKSQKLKAGPEGHPLRDAPRQLLPLPLRGRRGRASRKTPTA